MVQGGKYPRKVNILPRHSANLIYFLRIPSVQYMSSIRDRKNFFLLPLLPLGKEFSVMAAYAKEEDYMVGVFMLNSDRPDLWELSDIMKEIRV